MRDDTSRPFRPDPKHCCEKCVWGTGGKHAEWCVHRKFEDLTETRTAEFEAQQRAWFRKVRE